MGILGGDWEGGISGGDWEGGGEVGISCRIRDSGKGRNSSIIPSCLIRSSDHWICICHTKLTTGYIQIDFV